jgi:hypothetical protein
MLKISSSFHGIKQFEELCEYLTNIGLAEIYKEPVDGRGTSVTGYNLEKVYQLFVNPHGFEEGGKVNARFFYDERKNEDGYDVNKATMRCTKRGLETVLRSATVVDILSKHNIKLKGADGRLDLNELTRAAQLINKDIVGIERVSEEEFIIKTKDE